MAQLVLRAALTGIAIIAFASCREAAQQPAPVAAQPGPDLAALPAAGFGGSFNVPVVSFQDMPFRRVERQAYDFSCGAAAVATLLSFHYGRPTEEQEVFQAMWEAGDQAKIQREGFSLLDMKNYLDRLGLETGGFRVAVGGLIEQKVPVIAMVDIGGYRHFVVVKGIDGGQVLIGDPARGNYTLTEAAFTAAWNGVVLAVLSDMDQARTTFNAREEWAMVEGYDHNGEAVRRGEVGGAYFGTYRPTQIQIRPILGTVP